MPLAPQQPQRDATTTPDVAPKVDAATPAAPSSETPQKQAALRDAGDAALSRMTPAADEKLKVIGRSDAATSSAHVDLAQPAEASVTSVDDDGHPTFNVTMHLPTASIRAQDIDPAQLAQVTGVVNEGGAERDAAVSVKKAGDGVDLLVAGVSSLKGVNATGYKLLLANGQSVALTVSVHAWHTDETEWRRAGMRQNIKGMQDTIATFQKVVLEEQQTAKTPPPPDPSVAKDQASLVSTTAQLDALNAKINARVEQLAGEWQTMNPTLRSQTVKELGGDLAPKAQQLDALAAQRQPVLQQRDDAQQQATSLHQGLDGMDQPPQQLVDEMKQNDAKLAALNAQLAELDGKIAALSSTIMQSLEAQKDVLDKLMAEYESWIALNEKAPDEPLQTALNQRFVLQSEIGVLKSTIADKMAEPGKIAAASKAHAGQHQQLIADYQQKVVAAQAELAALKGPLYVTLGEDGLPVKVPAADAGAPAKQ